MVEVGFYPYASSILQELLRLFNGKDRVDMMQEKMKMDSMEHMVYSEVGH